ncbi:TPA: hypothetical protein ACGO3U_001856 [Streptococcus suis]
MNLKNIKKRLAKLVDHTAQGDIICIIFPNDDSEWLVEWNDGKTASRRDCFPTKEKAVEFAESLKDFDVIDHRRKNNVVIIIDDWYNLYCNVDEL